MDAGLDAGVSRRLVQPADARYINVEFVEEHYDSFLREVGPKVRPGDIRYREDIVDGLDKAPEAFIGMLAGLNFGKVLVRLS
jgi:NADPH-dependent curcumin reductase CurA